MRRVVVVFVLTVLGSVMARADRAAAQTYDPQGQKLVGRIHDANRAGMQRQELSLGAEIDTVRARYARAKKEIQDTTGVTYSMETSVLSQWGTPNGGYGAVQAMFTPAVNWDIFSSPTVGDGSLQFHFLAAQYWSGATGASLGANIGVNSPINNQPTANQQFVQLTYTHGFPGEWLSLSVGQYALSNFDGNAYANDQQVNFIGYALTQNGSQNYSQAGLGAYAQLNPTRDITFAAGFQDANDFSGSYIQFPTLGQGQYAWFLYGAWSPTVAGWGQGTYALLYYNQPGVALQPLASDRPVVQRLAADRRQMGPVPARQHRLAVELRHPVIDRRRRRPERSAEAQPVRPDRPRHGVERHQHGALWRLLRAAQRDHGRGLLGLVGLPCPAGLAERAALPAAGAGAERQRRRRLHPARHPALLRRTRWTSGCLGWCGMDGAIRAPPRPMTAWLRPAPSPSSRRRRRRRRPCGWCSRRCRG